MESFLRWFVGLVMPVQEIFILPWVLYSLVENIFSSPYTVFKILCPPSSSKLGRQSCWVACLVVYVSLIRDRCLVPRDVFCHIVSCGPCHWVLNIFYDFYELIKLLNLIFAVFIIFWCILKIVCHFLKVYFASIYMYTVQCAFLWTCTSNILYDIYQNFSKSIHRRS